ncbi:10118_t:CDS:10 [Entrophospora sp. SA101]|nr:10118_t:CDS:10 [Entrophospora sp. SA101]
MNPNNNIDNSGGGGERVLWTTIHSIQEKNLNVICVVYTGDVDVTKKEILSKVLERFNIEIKSEIVEFIFLHKREWVVDRRYPRFTLLGQSIGSMVLGYEALNKLTPDIYFDTMGYAFTYPIAKKLFGCKVLAYVHYPTISSDMLAKVQERILGFNNDKIIAKSRLFSEAKLLYYKIFAYLYSLSGSYADIVMVNSTWTKGHIDQLWGINSNIVYPPCDTDSLSKLPLDGRERIIVSVAQFRPEKDHELQLKSLHCLLRDHQDFREGSGKVKLVLIGSSRDLADESRIEALKEKENVKFEVNADFNTLVDWLSKAKVGLHTMWNEHFGIGIVEYMAAGIIPIAHNSGGPKMDIVIPYNDKTTGGFLANNEENFAKELYKVFSLSGFEYNNIQINARELIINFLDPINKTFSFIEPNVLEIGRDEVRVDDKALNKIQARFEIRNGKVYVTSLGSNVMMRGSEQIRKNNKVEVQHGETLTLMQTKYPFTVSILLQSKEQRQSKDNFTTSKSSSFSTIKDDDLTIKDDHSTFKDDITHSSPSYQFSIGGVSSQGSSGSLSNDVNRESEDEIKAVTAIVKNENFDGNKIKKKKSSDTPKVLKRKVIENEGGKKEEEKDNNNNHEENHNCNVDHNVDMDKDYGN